ncbi:MAG: hypothetical protein RR442_04280 [Muribaculaceae bacterium]
MKHKTYIFNPDNDLALAFGGENYTAPPMATCLRYDLQMLPAWYCDENSSILANAPENQQWLDNLSKNLHLKSEIIKTSQLSTIDTDFMAWGWSHDMRKRLIDCNVPQDRLPSKNYIDKIRNLSHRSTSIIIHNALREELSMNFSPIPIELHDFDSIKSFAKEHQYCYIKAPWSSSGKGIFRVLDINAIDFKRWTNGILLRQGSLLCEEALDKVLDFAMEFYCKNGIATFSGYSIFNNDNHCSFDNGLVMPTMMLHNNLIAIYGNENIILDVRNTLEKILTTIIAPHYTGYLGIDMLFYRDAKKIKLNPCVELNLRMTMGMVTSIIGDKLLAPQSQGKFAIRYYKTTQEIVNTITQKAIESPIKYSNGKIISGTQFLTPTYQASHYAASLEIQRFTFNH